MISSRIVVVCTSQQLAAIFVVHTAGDDVVEAYTMRVGLAGHTAGKLGHSGGVQQYI